MGWKSEGRNPKAERGPKSEGRTPEPNHHASGPNSHAPRITHHASPATRAITLDIGGTLIECWPSVGHVYAEVAARHGCQSLDPARLNRQFAQAWRARKDFRHSRAEWAALVDDTFCGLIPEPPSQSFFSALYDRFLEPDAWHVYEDVVPALEALKARGFRLGVISNWDERLRPLLRGLKLEPYFESIVVSCEVGAPKPSPLIFQEAARQLRLAPEAILHIGDSPEMDVAGARQAGFHSVLLERGVENIANGSIKSLLELSGAQG